MNTKGKVRIIGGQHRGRKKVSIVDNVIKPTKDRVRETLFNWLAFQTEGKRCLDLLQALVSWELKPCQGVQATSSLLIIEEIY
jgi:hypothetical protein